MSLLKNPSEIKDAIRLTGMFYGPPGVGKSTLALSAPKPVMIDADDGMRRVLKRFQVPSLPLTNYADLLALLDSSEVDPFDTIVIDTTGRLIERIGDYVAAENPTYRQKDGSLSLKGFGKLKIEFQRLLRLARDHKKHLIFVAHDKEERDGDLRIIRPDMGPGASGKELVKDLEVRLNTEFKTEKYGKVFWKSIDSYKDMEECESLINGNGYEKFISSK